MNMKNITLNKKSSITDDNKIQQKEKSTITSKNDAILNTQTEKIDNSVQVQEKSPIIREMSSAINTEKDKVENATDVIAINCKVQIPSMLKTQMMLDKKYIGESTSSTNMTLKIMKKQK